MALEVFMQQAVKCHNAGLLDEAENLYKKALSLSPKNPEILNLLGLVFQAKGADNLAVDCFYEALLINPFSQEYHFSLAFSLENLMRYNEAIDHYNKAAGVKEALNNIGNIYKKTNKVFEAKEYYQKALRIDEDYIEPKINLAFLNFDINKLQEFDNYLARYYLALICFEKNDNKKALDYLLDDFEFDYQHLLKAEILFAEKNFIEAKEHFNKALEINPSNYKALLFLADVNVILNDFDLAQSLYEKLLSVEPKNINAIINYANLLSKMGNKSLALEEYRKAILIDEKNFAALNNLAVIIKETGDYDEALGLFFAALNVEPKNDEVNVNILETLVLFSENNKKDALNIAKNWQKHYPDNIYAKHLLARFENKSIDDKEFNKKFFDVFSDNYEQVLENINYSLLQKVVEIFGTIKGRVLDLGCGSGLLGKKIKNNDNAIIGVDVSQKMLNLAEEKQVYDKLICADVNEYIVNDDNFDFVFALDVFCYIGDLSSVISGLKNKCFLFSVESDVENKDFELQINGRYKHAHKYVEKLLSDIEHENKEVVLRTENGKDVMGMIYYKK